MSFWYEWYFAVKLATSTMKRISKPHCLHRRFCQIMPIENFLTFAYELSQQSSGKLMFSQVSVCHSVQGKGLGTLYASYDRSLYPIGHQNWEPTPPSFRYCWHLVVITGDLFKFVHLRTYPPLVLTSSDAHRAGGTHPTRMLSCCRKC